MRIVLSLFALCVLLAAPVAAQTPATLGTLVQEAREQLDPVAAQRGVRCRVDIRGDSLVSVDEAASMRERVISMLANALVSAPTGSEVVLSVDPRWHEVSVWVPDASLRQTGERTVSDSTGHQLVVRMVAGRGTELKSSLLEGGLVRVP